MTGVLITGGEKPPYKQVEEVIALADIVCLADSGYDYCLHNCFDFDILLGDMDSVKAQVGGVPSHKILQFPRDKDYTDTELGLKYLYDRGCDEVVLIGAGGGRTDHLLAVYSLFYRPVRPHVWYTSCEKIIFTEGRFVLEGRAGSEVSVFPVSNSNCTMKSIGLKWNLEGLNWRTGSVGISNVITSDYAEITAVTGALLILLPLLGNEFDG